MSTTAYTRLPQRLVFGGLALWQADLLAQTLGKCPYAQNIRSYQEGTIQPREGNAVVTSGPLAGGAIHSIWRLNDPTTFAPAAAMRYLGAGAVLYARAPAAGAYNQIDTGYSGDPLSFVNAAPLQSPQPWTYIGDRTRTRKVNTANTIVPIGIAQPNTAPVLTLGAPGATVISELDVAADWANVGGGIVGALSNVAAVNTTISVIVYDSGNTGYCSIYPAAFTNIHVGQRLILNAAETVLVTDVLPTIATTTIAAIIYDSGNTGLCTIQPAASLGVGQLESPRFDEARRRFDPAWDAAEPAPTPIERIRSIDFPVNCLIKINTGGGTEEWVRIISAAVGRDGVQSFRCSTANTHAAGESLTGGRCFRAFTTATRSAGNTIVGNVIQHVITPTTVDPVVAGIQDTTLAVDCALVGGRATQDEDELLLSVKVDTLSAVQAVRIYLDVDAVATDFLSNYYWFEWRQNDILSAVHSTNTAVPDPVSSAREDAVLQNQIDQSLLDEAMDPKARLKYISSLRNAANRSAAEAQALSATSQQLALGNNQWIALKVKIRDLIHTGTDLSRSLASVGGAEVLLTISGTTAPVTVQYDSALIQGGYGPDVGDTGHPYVYGYRYRSSTTGAKSNMSPPSRGGVVPRRQRVTGTATASGDSQADLIDWFRFGGNLTRWTYVMTASALTDDFLDGAIEAGELPAESYQPWPTADLPRSGTCNVSGTAVSRVGGDTFNTSWAPGTAITVNGITTTLYASPSSTSFLHLTDNVGSGTAVAWSIREPVLLSQALPVHWGGPVQSVVFLFACGDTHDPGALYWTIGNDPDATKDANWLAVTQASEPLQNGFVYDGLPFTFSTEQLYRIEPTFGGINTFRATQTACGKGLWSRWAFAVAPEGVYFLAKDGIYLTAFGSPAVSITDPELREIFPHDGAAGITVNTIAPPDMTQPKRLRLSVIDTLLYFDYNTGSVDRTLVYDRINKRWYHDIHALSGVQCRLSEGGAQVQDHLLGCADGHLYQTSATAYSDAGTAIAWKFYTPWADGGDLRSEKQFGDVLLDYNMQGATQNLSIVVVSNNATASLAAQTFGAATTGRTQTTLDLNAGAGVLARNLGLQVTGSSVAADTGRPLLFAWEPAFLPKHERSEARATDWDSAGYAGTKQFRGVIIRANTFNVAKELQVQYDGGTVAQTISLTANGERKIAFALTPFHARLVRLMPTTETPWICYEGDVEWVADPKPELIAEYTDWDDAGRVGEKYLTGIVLRVDTGGVAGVQVQIQIDNSAVAATVTLAASTGEDGQAFSFTPPIYAHLMRLVPLGAVRIVSRQWLLVPKPELIAEYTDWLDAGYQGAKFMQGVVLRVDTNGVARTIQIQYEDGVVGATISVPATTGEDGIAFSFPVPFVAHVLRLIPSGPLRILNAEWKFEPAPELGSYFETQASSYDVPGYVGVRDLVVAHQSTADLTLTVTYSDGPTQTYTIGHSAGVYAREYVIAQAGKGTAVKFQWSSAAAFRLFKRDMSVRMIGWGLQTGYLQTMPFGGPSRADGAAI